LGGKSPWVARYREADGWGLYKAASLGFGFRRNADVASRTRGRHHGAAARWGRRPWRGRRELLRSHVVHHREEDREKKRWRKRTDRWTPHVSCCGGLVGGSWAAV
jgi:hypothetical protein